MPSQQSHIPLPAEDVHGFSLDDLALYTALTEFNYCHSEPAHPVVHDQVLADINPADLIPNINPFDTSFNDDPELINGYVCASPALSEASFDFSAYLVDDSKSNQSQPVVQNAPVVAAVTDPVATATGPVATTVLAPTQVVGKVPNPVVTVATGPVATVQAATQVAGAVPTSVVTVAPVTAATGSVTAAQPPVQAPASVASFIPMSVTPAQVPQAADQAFVPWTPVSMAAPAVPKYASAVQANAPVASTLGSHFASTGFSQVTGLTHLVTMMPLNMLELASHHVELVNNPVREIVNVKHEDIVAFTQSGHTDCLQFSSLAEALADHAHNCEPPLDHTIPRTVAAKKVYVMLLCQALQTIQFAIDGPKTMKTFLNANFSSKLVELRAWEMVENMCFRHLDGRPATFGKSGRAYETYLDRFRMVINVLLRRSTVSKHVLDPSYMASFLEDPKKSDSRADQNKTVNDRKKQQIMAGKFMLGVSGLDSDNGLATAASPGTPAGQMIKLPTPPNSTDANASTSNGTRKRKADRDGVDVDGGSARKRPNNAE